jgi:DNA-directed RNA polymerase subunit F
LQEILDRLKEFNFLDSETMNEVVQSLLSEEDWPMSKVLAHLDMIDHDERT